MWSLILSSVCGLGPVAACRPVPRPLPIVRQDSTVGPASEDELLSAQEGEQPASAVPS